jgi:peptidoglycan/LPS O-acetylase OafA/YrhL
MKKTNLLQVAISNRRSINVLRVLLAFSVLIYHMGVLGGFQFNPIPKLGQIAVGLFFGISGFFVTISAKRNTLKEYLLGRILRIYPAFLSSMVLFALVIAPIFYVQIHGNLNGYFNNSPYGPFRYLYHNFFMPQMLQAGIHDVFIQSTPYGKIRQESIIFGSLWTLPYEFRFYLLLVLLKLTKWRITLGLFLAMFAYLFTVTLISTQDSTFDSQIAANLPGQFNIWLFTFLSGAVLGLLAEKISLSRGLKWILGFLGFSVFLGTTTLKTYSESFELLGYALSPWIIVVFTQSRLVNKQSIFDNDISFGVYIYGFAVQQTMSALGLNIDFLFYFVVCTLVTTFLSILSWVFIEEPVLKKRRSRTNPH